MIIEERVHVGWLRLTQYSMEAFIPYVFNPAALLRLRGSSDKVFAELEEMKEEAAHTQSGVTIHEFFKRRSYRQPIKLVLIVNLGSQLSGFNAVSHMKWTSSPSALRKTNHGRSSPHTSDSNFVWNIPERRPGNTVEILTLALFFQIINYSTRMFQAKFDQAKYLTLGVGAVNVTFTLVAVSTNSSNI